MDFFKKFSETIVDSTVGILNAWQRKSIQMVKIEAAKYYLKTVQAVRRQSLALVTCLFCLLMLAVAVVVMPVVLLLFSPLAVADKLKLACVLAAVEIGIPALWLANFFSQKNWMKFTRSNEMIADAVRED